MPFSTKEDAQTGQAPGDTLRKMLYRQTESKISGIDHDSGLVGGPYRGQEMEIWRDGFGRSRYQEAALLQKRWTRL